MGRMSVASDDFAMQQEITMTQEMSFQQTTLHDNFGSSKSSLGQPSVEPLPSDVSVSIGKTLTLMTSWSGSNSNSEATWYINGMSVDESDRIRIDTIGNSSTLSIMNATPDDAGLYRITVKNDLGSDTSETIATIM